ncbi:hypothetical protein NOCARDAX2BIS_210176 [Nocardioides sp. AX2bis]|nr:hypothetical protein NOCARDAX2BIS_210176 [Nocardioides sp. AX2bis]
MDRGRAAVPPTVAGPRGGAAGVRRLEQRQRGAGVVRDRRRRGGRSHPHADRAGGAHAHRGGPSRFLRPGRGAVRGHRRPARRRPVGRLRRVSARRAVPGLGSGHGRRGRRTGVHPGRPHAAPREGAPLPGRVRPDAA